MRNISPIAKLEEPHVVISGLSPVGKLVAKVSELITSKLPPIADILAD